MHPVVELELPISLEELFSEDDDLSACALDELSNGEDDEPSACALDELSNGEDDDLSACALDEPSNGEDDEPSACALDELSVDEDDTFVSISGSTGFLVVCSLPHETRKATKKIYVKDFFIKLPTRFLLYN